jgi:predicted phosphohydrolase
MALQRTLGISYKDAAHRLYMAELERLKAERRAEQAFSALRERVDKTVFQEIYPPIIQIDAGNFDSTVPEVPPPGDK